MVSSFQALVMLGIDRSGHCKTEFSGRIVEDFIFGARDWSLGTLQLSKVYYEHDDRKLNITEVWCRTI
jgi:hypothetical protein